MNLARTHSKGRLKLAVTMPARPPKNVCLLDLDRVWIGRHEEADVFLLDPDISRRHAEIRADEGAYRIVDLGSKLHTILNDEELDQHVEYPLNDGDKLRFGNWAEAKFSTFAPIDEEDLDGSISPLSTRAGEVSISADVTNAPGLGEGRGSVESREDDFDELEVDVTSPGPEVGRRSRLPGARLEIASGRSKGAAYILVSSEVGIGSSEGAAIVLDSPGMAAVHARIRTGAGEFLISGTDKDAPIYLDGRRIETPTVLRPGGRLILASANIKVSRY